MRGWLRLGVVALCVALTPASAYAGSPSPAADQFRMGASLGVAVSRAEQPPAAAQRKSSSPINLLLLHTTVVAISALLATGVVLHYAGSRHRYERQELVGDVRLAAPALLEPAEGSVDLALLNRIKRYSHHASDEDDAPPAVLDVELADEVGGPRQR